ncbi:hypothetical protein GY45DRAFT_957625 [Cubamyces sp. BRFM 1775]|nr:hypothetical protein GY45DRAFT_957625 [Cubamyces sp. BRFM 1775]
MRTRVFLRHRAMHNLGASDALHLGRSTLRERSSFVIYSIYSLSSSSTLLSILRSPIERHASRPCTRKWGAAQTSLRCALTTRRNHMAHMHRSLAGDDLWPDERHLQAGDVLRCVLRAYAYNVYVHRTT